MLVGLQCWAMREDGQDLVEYSLITGLLAVAAFATLKATASSVTHLFTNISSTLNAA